MFPRQNSVYVAGCLHSVFSDIPLAARATMAERDCVPPLFLPVFLPTFPSIRLATPHFLTNKCWLQLLVLVIMPITVAVGTTLSKGEEKAYAEVFFCICLCCGAERKGFEPLKGFWPLLAFQAGLFNHSSIFPNRWLQGRYVSCLGVFDHWKRMQRYTLFRIWRKKTLLFTVFFQPC